MIVCASGRFAEALQITPPRQEVVLSVGESASGTVEAYNETSSTVAVHVSLKEWFQLMENKEYPISTWLDLKNTEFELRPGEKRIVPFTVRVPTGTAPAQPPSGFLMGMLSFAADDGEQSMVNLVMSVSIYVTVKGTERPEAVITKCGIGNNKGSLEAAVEVANKGNIHLRPTGKVEIADKKGRVVDSNVFQEGWPVFPGQARTYQAKLEGNWKPGYYRQRVSIQLWDKVQEKDFGFKLTKAGQIVPLPEKKARKIWKDLKQ